MLIVSHRREYAQMDYSTNILTVKASPLLLQKTGKTLISETQCNLDGHKYVHLHMSAICIDKIYEFQRYWLIDPIHEI